MAIIIAFIRLIRKEKKKARKKVQRYSSNENQANKTQQKWKHTFLTGTTEAVSCGTKHHVLHRMLDQCYRWSIINYIHLVNAPFELIIAQATLPLNIQLGDVPARTADVLVSDARDSGTGRGCVDSYVVTVTEHKSKLSFGEIQSSLHLMQRDPFSFPYIHIFFTCTDPSSPSFPRRGSNSKLSCKKMQFCFYLQNTCFNWNLQPFDFNLFCVPVFYRSIDIS